MMHGYTNLKIVTVSADNTEELWYNSQHSCIWLCYYLGYVTAWIKGKSM
jgi:hypothetical protein